MDRSHHQRRFALVLGIASRIRALSTGPAFGRRLLGSLLLLTGILLAHWANLRAESRAHQDWLTQHTPSRALWKAVLSGHGYFEVTAIDTLQKVSRFISSGLDERNPIWLSQDLQWIAVLPEVYSKVGSRRPPHQAGDWTRMGIGWNGFEALLQKLETPPQTQPVPAQKSRPDSRGLHY